MNKYLIISRKTGNRVEVEYDHRGLLVGIRFEGEPEEAAVDAMLARLPRQEAGVVSWYSAQFEVLLVPSEIKFEVFWEAYGKKTGKKAAETQWQKLLMPDRAKAIRSIVRYRQFCQSQSPPRMMKDPERYLSNRTFDDELNI